MKKFNLLLVCVFITGIIFAQNQAPVAINDTIFEPVHFGDTITINVIQNDYDPDGDNFAIFNTGPGQLYDIYYENTDSTIIFSFNPILHVRYGGDYVFNYLLMDEFGNTDINSGAQVYFTLINESYAFLDVNNVSARFNAYGNHFWDLDALNHYQFPKDSLSQSIWNFTLWLGGIDEDETLRIAAERYRQMGQDYVTGPLSFNSDSAWITNDVISDYLKIWKLNKSEIEYHIFHWSEPGYEPIENIATWPAHGDAELNQAEYLAPFVDLDNNGLYEPMSGDYPLIRGDQTLFFIYNDAMLHTETGGNSIGAEIHGFAYAFDAPEKPYLNNTTFLSYKIFNRSQNFLDRTFAGLFSDIDLGSAYDDYVGCDIARGAYYCYNGDSIDGEGTPESYGAFPPAQGIIVLGGPYLDSDGEDNPSGGCDVSINGVGFGDGEVDNERYGMNNFIYFNNGGNMYGVDPSSADEYYNYLKGIWMDGTEMIYGGNGHSTSGAYGPEAKFMYPGLSDPCNWGTGGTPPNGPVEWTEVTVGNEPGDRRGLCSMGPFTLEPGGFHKIDIAFVSAIGDNYMHSVDVLMEAIDSVKYYYNQDSDHFGYAWMGEEEKIYTHQRLAVFPNPSTNKVNFNYSTKSNEATYELYNSIGKLVKSGLLSNETHQSINIQQLFSGIYILKIIDRNEVSTVKFLKR